MFGLECSGCSGDELITIIVHEYDTKIVLIIVDREHSRNLMHYQLICYNIFSSSLISMRIFSCYLAYFSAFYSCSQSIDSTLSKLQLDKLLLLALLSRIFSISCVKVRTTLFSFSSRNASPTFCTLVLLRTN